MSLSIGPLEGFFDGDSFIKGPVVFDIDKGKIENIRFEDDNITDVDGSGKILLPTFTDGHTHLIFAGERFFELDMKLKGLNYTEILEKGGGINHTVQQTRNTSFDELYELVMERLDVFLAHGCLDVEVKSGYGLSTEHELRLLEILKVVNENHIIDIHPTFGAAHVVPPEKSRDEYISEVIDDMLPIVKNKKLAMSTDVFCDRGAFTVSETMDIFSASASHDIPVRVHAEELEYTGIAEKVADEFNCLSADHLLNADKKDFEALAINNTVAMFMPLAPFGLFTNSKPKGFKKTNVQIGIGSDFNPNNWAASIQSAIRMAVFSYQLSPIQALNAATKGSYLGVTGSEKEKLQIGSSANFLLVQSKSPDEFVSKFGQNLVDSVYKSGRLVHSNDHKVV